MALIPVYNESELLSEIAKDNEKAFSELFHAYHNQLGEFVLLLTDSQEMTEEIISDVFLKVWIKRETLKEIKKFTSYLFILTRNTTLNTLRKAHTERKYEQNYGKLQLLEENYSLIQHETEVDYQPVIDEAILKLPPQQQKVFKLKQEGFKNAEIAEQLSICPQSVKKYQQWAIQSVSKYVKSSRASTTLILLIFYFI